MKTLILLTGIVLSLITKEPLTGVKIQYQDKVVYTDFDGKFTLSADSVKISYISYKDTLVKNDSIIFLTPLK